jgi:ankyrin repeat protein
VSNKFYDLLKDADNNTLLHFAALENRPFVISDYLKRHFEILPKNVKNQTPIHLASQSGSLEFIKTFTSILAKETLTRELDTPDINGHTPLMLAGMNGHINVLDFLLKQNVNVNHQEVENEDFLLHLLVKRERNKALEFLLKWNAQDQNGRLDIDLHNKQGRTALHCAAECANEEAINILCSFDASLSMLDSENKTPLNLAIQSKCPHVERIKQSVLALIKCGVDYNQIEIATIDDQSLKDLITNYMSLNVELSAPLLASLLKIYTGRIRLSNEFRFLKSNIDFNSIETPQVIYEFFSKGNDQEIEFFKRFKLSFSSVNASGDNVFHIAAKLNDKQCLEKLFNSGISDESLVECDVKNNRGDFVLDFINRGKNKQDKNELAELLSRNNFKNTTNKSPDKSPIIYMLYLLAVVFCVIVLIMDMNYLGLI